MKNLFTILLILTSIQLFGRIEIINNFPASTQDACDGIIQLNLIGTGGNFNILIAETGQEIENVSGNIFIENLCIGTYTIYVSLRNFLSCEKTLNAEIISIPNANSGISSLETQENNGLYRPESDKIKFFDKEIIITPNPNQGVFKIYFKNEISNQTFFELYTNKGQLILSAKIEEKEISVQQTNLPPGIYFARFIQDDLIIQTNEIVIH